MLCACKLRLAHTHLYQACFHHYFCSWPLHQAYLKQVACKNLFPMRRRSREDRNKGECCLKRCSAGKEWKHFELGRCHCMLSMPGISNWTESQLDCLWFSSKSRQDTKLSSESLRVSYLFNSPPDAPFGSHKTSSFLQSMIQTKKVSKNHSCACKRYRIRRAGFLRLSAVYQTMLDCPLIYRVCHSLRSFSPCCLITGLQITHTKA